MDSVAIIGGADGPTAVFVTGIGFSGISGYLEGWMLAVGAVCILAAYFLGSISPATIIGRMKGIDIKKEGSGNAGTTNVLRVLGKKAAAVTLVIDIGKGVLAVLIGRFVGMWLDTQMSLAINTYQTSNEECFFYALLLPMFCALFVLIGHVWPLILRFKGGKGVATAFGALVTLCPPIGLIALGIVLIIIAIWRRVSLGSMIGAVSVPILAWIFMPEFLPIAVIMAAIVLIKHRSNFIRLIKGEESKISFKK